VYEKHKFAIANLKVKGHDLVRISPTFCNTASDVEGVVEAVVDVMQGLKNKKLASGVHTKAYA
jgi:selenocysteine lyase/cysteine desulfurase